MADRGDRVSYHVDQPEPKLYPLSIVEEKTTALAEDRGGWSLKTIVIVLLLVGLVWYLWSRSKPQANPEGVPGLRIVVRVRDRLRSGRYLSEEEMQTLSEQLSSFLRLVGSE